MTQLKAAVFCCVVGTSILPCRGGPADEMLEKLEQKRARVETLYHVTVTTTTEGKSTRRIDSQTWAMNDGGTWKLRVASTTTVQGKDEKTSGVSLLTVSDGTHEWRETPAGDRRMVIKSKAAPQSPLAHLRNSLKGSRLSFEGRENILRQPCVVLKVNSKGRGPRFQSTYWISEKYGVVLRSVVVRMDRSETKVETTEFVVNEPIAEDRFSYDPPKGAMIIDTESLGKGSGG